MSSTSVGSRPNRRKFASRYSISSGASARPSSPLARSSAARPSACSAIVVKRPRRHMDEQSRCLGEIRKDGLHHAIVDERQERRAILRRQRCAVAAVHAVHDAALDAGDRRQSAVARDVGRLRRPRRNRAGSRHDEQQRAVDVGVGDRFGTVGQQRFERAALVRRQRTRQLDEMPERGIERVDAMGGTGLRQALQQLGEPERRERRPARQREDFGHRRRGRKRKLYASRSHAPAPRPRVLRPRAPGVARGVRRNDAAVRERAAIRSCRCASRRRPSSRHRHRRSAGTRERRGTARDFLPRAARP